MIHTVEHIPHIVEENYKNSNSQLQIYIIILPDIALSTVTDNVD